MPALCRAGLLLICSVITLLHCYTYSLRLTAGLYHCTSCVFFGTVHTAVLRVAVASLHIPAVKCAQLYLHTGLA